MMVMIIITKMVNHGCLPKKKRKKKKGIKDNCNVKSSCSCCTNDISKRPPHGQANIGQRLHQFAAAEHLINIIFPAGRLLWSPNEYNYLGYGSSNKKKNGPLIV